MSFKNSLKDTFFHISINSLGLHLSPECLLNFLSKFYIPHCMGKTFKFMVLTFLEHALNLGIFTHAPPPHPKLSPKFLSSHRRPREITHFTRQHFFKNLFPPTAERGEGNYDLIYQNSIRRYEMTWNIKLFIFYMICNCSNMVVLQFCK